MLLSAFGDLTRRGGGGFKHFKCNLSKGRISSQKIKNKIGASCPQYKKGITEEKKKKERD